jgi:predicted amidophosphoribosyltransferase
LRDGDILLVDDVMTSGATFAAATEALFAAGARSVSVLVWRALRKTAEIPIVGRERGA